MKTVLSIVGTRPEAIKMAPVVKELRSRAGEFRSVLCSTGQHRQMLDQSLGFFGLVPDVDLKLMTHNQTLSSLTASLFSALDPVIVDTKPDWILAQGDTTSVMVASVLAYYHKIPFGHVEAGLRTQDKFQPFPEEMNRRLADQASDLLFAPTETARANLLKEGFDSSKIHVTGNTVVDALISIKETAYDWAGGPLAKVDRNRPWVLITAHRRESFGEPFRHLCQAIRSLGEAYSAKGYQFIYPVHLNPNVRGPVSEILGNAPGVTLLDPLDYRSFIEAMAGSTVILTDSGGVQEEAPGLGVPVLVMRETTERPEGVAAGVSVLVGTNQDTIVSKTAQLIDSPELRKTMTRSKNPYGDGTAARQIVDLLAK